MFGRCVQHQVCNKLLAIFTIVSFPAGMGNSAAKDLPKDELQDAVDEVFEIFSPIYLKAYALFCLEAAKSRMHIASPFREPAVTRQLLDLPMGDAPLATGWMRKLGEGNHSWKRRFFVLKNTSMNYVWVVACAVRHFCSSPSAGIGLLREGGAPAQSESQERGNQPQILLVCLTLLKYLHLMNVFHCPGFNG